MLGKTIRTIEYPDGDLVTVNIRSNNVSSLKNAVSSRNSKQNTAVPMPLTRLQILKGQTPIYPGVELREDEVQHLVRWSAPCFTEPIASRRDMKLIPDGGWVFWSRQARILPPSLRSRVNPSNYCRFPEEIPRRGVTLEYRGREEERQDGALKFIASLARSPHPEEKLSRREEELLTDLVVDKDEGILTIYRCAAGRRATAALAC